MIILSKKFIFLFKIRAPILNKKYHRDKKEQIIKAFLSWCNKDFVPALERVGFAQ